MPSKTSPGPRPVRAPRGTDLSCRGWPQEAALRLLMNNLDPEVARDPDHLIVYGGRGKAARDWASFDRIVATLRTLGPEETLLIQSGKPVGVFPTHADAPRVLIANANLVPRWATDEIFWDLEARGLTMYGQMTAGSWIYIGTQGILQGTYETLASLSRLEFHAEDLTGRWMLSSGLGEMGGAQPLAVTLLGGVALVVDVDPRALERRLAHHYLDVQPKDLDDALHLVREAVTARRGLSVGLEANAADVFPEVARRGIVPDVVSDQTAAHDLRVGYIPQGLSVEGAAELRGRDPESYLTRVRTSLATEARAILELQRRGAHAFDYGNNFRTQARDSGVADAFDIPGYVPRYIRPLFAVGSGPFRWVALSGDPEDIRRHRPDDPSRGTPTGPGCAGGSVLLGSGSSSRDCPPVSVTWGMVNGIDSAISSTTWCMLASSRPQSRSVATITTPVVWPVRSGRPRACETGPMRSPIGRS